MIEGLHPPTIIALCAVVASLGFILNMLIAPLKAKLAAFEAELKEVKQNQVRFEAELKEVKQNQISIEAKLDLLLKANGKG